MEAKNAREETQRRGRRGKTTVGLTRRRKTGRVVLTFVCAIRVYTCVYINICVYNMLVASQEEEWDEEEAKVEAGQKRNRRNEFISANATS